MSLTAKRRKIYFLGAAFILAAASLSYLIYTGKISADTLESGTVTVDPTQGEVFSSAVSNDIAPNELKISAVPKSAGFQFNHWESSSSNCSFLDSTKAITIATVNNSCQMTAKFSPSAMTADTASYTPICTAADLDKIRTNLSGNFIQTCDIDLAGIAFEPIANNSDASLAELLNSSYPDPSTHEVFKGIYDGNGKIIKNLTIDKNNFNTGLFSANNGTIRNTTIENFSVIGGQSHTGSLVGENGPAGILSNIVVSGSATNRGKAMLPEGETVEVTIGGNVGGVAGTNYGTISSAVANVNITGSSNSNGFKEATQYYGGITGWNQNSKIEKSYSIGSIKNVSAQAGGIAGFSTTQDIDIYPALRHRLGLIYDSFSAMNIELASTPTTGFMAGGLVGQVQGGDTSPNPTEIKNSFAIGDVSGTNNVGGLIGRMTRIFTIDNTYAAGNTIHGTSGAGGLICSAFGPDDSIISNSWTNVKIVTKSGAGGFITSAGGNGDKTTKHRLKIKNCQAKSVIIADGPGIDGVGGFFSLSVDSEVTDSRSETKISSNYDVRDVGGFVGMSSSDIYDNCSAISTIDTRQGFYLSGFIAVADQVKVTNSRATGSITGNKCMSGFFDRFPSVFSTVAQAPDDSTGRSNWSDPTTADYSILNSYSAMNMSSTEQYCPTSTNQHASSVGGFMRSYAHGGDKIMFEGDYWDKDLAGTTFSSYEGENGRTTAQMKQKATYVGWDFDNIWTISNTDFLDYPTLKTAIISAEASPTVTASETVANTATVSPSPTLTSTPSPTATPTATPAPTLTAASYTFHKGFNAFGSSGLVSLDSIKSNGLYLYKYNSSTNSWSYYPGSNITPEANRGYYIYNPSATKTVTLNFSPGVATAYNLTKGWNLFYADRSTLRKDLNLVIGGSTYSFNSSVTANKVFKKIYIIDNDQAGAACSYFKVLADTDSSSNCSSGTPANSGTIAAGKTFWVYSAE